MNTFDMIYETVKKIPKGQVGTYGQVAALAGSKRWARVVGYALHACPDPVGIPWHRVVKQDGSLAFDSAGGGRNLQKELLESEGVRFRAGKVIMKDYQWDTPWI